MSVNLGSVDKNLSELGKVGATTRDKVGAMDENTVEDDVAIAAAVAEIESELGAQRGLGFGMYLAVLLAVLAFYFAEERQALVQWLLEKVK